MTARTAQENPPTKERLLNAAQELVLAKGFAATTVDEICEQAKLTKGSFFHYFESKDQLGQEMLQRFCSSSAQMHRAFSGSDKDPLKRVYNYIDGVIKLSQDPQMGKGCLLGLFSQELCGDEKIRQACEKGFDDWIRQFGEELAQAKAKHPPRKPFNPQEVAEHMVAVIEGALILNKAKADRRLVTRHLEHFRAYVQGLFEG